jgi:hypothetical protein
MVVNKEQVIFWENLKDEDGANTVPGAIKQYKQTTTGEQNCEEQQQTGGGSSDSSGSSGTTTDDTANTDNTANDTDN